MKNLPPLRILVPVLIVVAFGVHRVRLLLLTTEETIERRIEFLMDGFEERQPNRIRRALTGDFTDEATGYDRRDVSRALNVVMTPGQRYRARLDEPGGITFLEPPFDGPDGDRRATVRVECLIEVRYGATDDYEEFWDLGFTADLVRRSGTWKIERTREVNHDERPRR